MDTPSPFLFGFKGTQATPSVIDHLRETHAAGVLLLGRNINSPAQTRKLILDLQKGVGRPLLISIDHEGGWVLRMTQGLSVFPGNAALGQAKDPAWTRKASRQMARELKSLGIWLNLAPVADVSGESYNPGIGIRSFAIDTKKVVKLTKEFICGHNDHNVGSCAKHFPGKGDARVDAHLNMPTIHTPYPQLMRRHIPPFKGAIKAQTPCLMTTHAAYPTLDPSKRAATYSRKIAHTLLRTRLGFKGVLISDDLCMGAVTRRRGVPQAAVDALRAGHDLLILADDPALQKKTANAVKRAFAQHTIPPQQQQESQKRLIHLMRRFARPPAGPLLKPNTHLPKKIATHAVRILQKGKVALPLSLNKEDSLNIYWPDMNALKHRFIFEGGPKGPLAHLRKHLSRWPGKTRYRTTSMSAFKAGTLPHADVTLFFCFDARFFPAERAALKHVQSRSKNVIVLLMRNPWDTTYLKPSTTALTAYGFRNCQIDAMLEALL